MASILETVGSVMMGETDLKELKKKVERALIKSVYAPLTKSSRSGIESKYDAQITKAASEGKATTATIVGQLDTAIRGKGRKAVESTVRKYKNDYDTL